ncbi:hypothetical protein BDP27DRAFT_1497896 [Rhodocollybia butyracea]|uniref:Uncharacterized protein n=1 Tax=Rhodocollybia butyracea TaxID=206335 RepID=A0A9P5PAJ0_9AGAR|nr:hypothetical protein BDP27DRAFT_1497896 [Rhodocollybia butyracea]
MTIAELQKELTDVASLILFASSTLDEDSAQNKEDEFSNLLHENDNLNWDGEEESWEEDWELDESSAAGLLELLGLSYMDLASSLTGDGSRGPYNQFPKPSDFFQCCLLAPDHIFHSVFRMGKHMFNVLHDKISSNSVFESRGWKPQRPVKYQLGMFLIRYGTLGSDSLDAALKLNIGHGTVFLYCRCVTRAIQELKSSYIGFPCLEDLQESSRIIEEKIGFP